MCQMTNFRKVLGTCLAVFALMGAQSCNREVAEPSEAEGKTHSEETIYKEGNVEMPVSENLVFDTAGENQLKALNATVNASASAGANSRHAVDYGQEFPVICVIRSDKADPVTYAELKVTKKADGTYKMSQDRVHLAQGSTLAPGKKWYLMVVTQNAFNKNNGELSVNAGAPEDLSSSATRVMDIPSASPWIELPMFPNGQPKWSKDWDTARKKQKLTLYPQGVLCRATLRLDDAYKAKLGGDNVNLKITQLKVVSTALSFSGKFKFDKASLPDLTETSGSPTLTWEPTPEASTAKEYRALDANTPEYQKVFNASNGGSVLQVSGNGSLATIFADSNNPTRVDKTNLPQGVQSIIFWAVPVKGTTNRHTTLIAERGESTLSNKVLAPSHTYIYGKKHTKDATQGSAVYFDAVYYNPYTPLDYMAEYNVKRKWPDQFVPGGWIPHGPSNEFDTEHGVNSFTFLTKEEVNQVSLSSGGRTYKSPTHAQWSSVIPYEGKAAINTTGGPDVDNADVNAEVGQLKSKTKFSSRVDTKKNIRYALALTDLGGSQKYRTAYRYRMDYGKGDLQIWAPYILKNTSRPNFLQDSRYNSSRLDNYVLTIQAVQLGAGFVGTVADIANEDFWNNTANQRKEERILPRNFTVYSVSSPLYNAPFNAWGDAPTVYYLGDNLLAAFNANFGTWGVVDMNSRGAYNLIHFPVRPFTKQER